MLSGLVANELDRAQRKAKKAVGSDAQEVVVYGTV